eukprot:jgi/Ulvmu1/277/UM001_0281.1
MNRKLRSTTSVNRKLRSTTSGSQACVTAGLGYVAARSLVVKGAHVLALNRPSGRATASSQQIRDECIGEAGGAITDIPCDLQSLDSVRAAGEQILQQDSVKKTGLDALVANAGVMALPDTGTGDGYDVQMQTNHLSHFLLTSIVFPGLQKAAEVSGSARIVNHSSSARIGGPCKAKFYGKNSGQLGGDGSLAKWERYHQTKLANALFSNALKDKLHERGLDNIKCFTCAPGLAASQLQANTYKNGGIIGLQPSMRFAQSAEDGTLPMLECIVGTDVQSGDLIVPSNKGFFGMLTGDGATGWPKKRQFEKVCVDEQGKKILWEESEKAVGPFFKG